MEFDRQSPTHPTSTAPPGAGLGVPQTTPSTPSQTPQRWAELIVPPETGRLGPTNGRRRIATRVVALLIGPSLAIGALAVPAQAASSGAQHFTGVEKVSLTASQPLWSVVGTGGVVNDAGTVRFGADDGITHEDLLVLAQGTIILAEPSNPTSSDFHFNPTTCIGSASESGTYQMTGTGRYSGLTGQGTWHDQATIIAPYKPGCSPDDPGTVAYIAFDASGTAARS